MKIMDFLIGRFGWAFLGAVIGFFYGSFGYLILKYFLANIGYLPVVAVFSLIFSFAGVVKGENLADLVGDAMYFLMGALVALLMLGSAMADIDKGRDRLVMKDNERSFIYFVILGFIAVLFIFFWIGGPGVNRDGRNRGQSEIKPPANHDAQIEIKKTSPPTPQTA